MKNKILEGKIAVITGGAKGIGRGVVELFNKEGAQVIIVDISKKEGKELAAGFKNVCFIRGNIADWEEGGDCEKVISSILADFGQIDILVNNAGAQTGLGFLKIGAGDIKDITKVKYLGPFKLMQLVARSMIERKIQGSIINITSVHSELIRGFPEYSAANAALKMASQEAAYELGPYGIRVNCIAPGATETQLGTTVLKAEGFDPKDFWSQPKNRQPIIKKTPLGRIGQPEDIARAALFLASNDFSSFITGIEIIVDGGFSLRNAAVEETDFPSKE